MWQQIVDLAISNGLWAVLFLFLLIFVLKDANKREKKYQDIIEKLGANIEIIKDVQEDVKDIKLSLEKTKRRKTKDEEV